MKSKLFLDNAISIASISFIGLLTLQIILPSTSFSDFSIEDSSYQVIEIKIDPIEVTDDNDVVKGFNQDAYQRLNQLAALPDSSFIYAITYGKSGLTSYTGCYIYVLDPDTQEIKIYDVEGLGLKPTMKILNKKSLVGLNPSEYVSKVYGCWDTERNEIRIDYQGLKLIVPLGRLSRLEKELLSDAYQLCQ